MILDKSDNPTGPDTRQEIVDYLAKHDLKLENGGKLAIKVSNHGGRTAKGASFDSEMGSHAYAGPHDRVSLDPKKASPLVGFRPVRR